MVVRRDSRRAEGLGKRASAADVGDVAKRAARRWLDALATLRGRDVGGEDARRRRRRRGREGAGDGDVVVRRGGVVEGGRAPEGAEDVRVQRRRRALGSRVDASADAGLSRAVKAPQSDFAVVATRRKGVRIRRRPVHAAHARGVTIERDGRRARVADVPHVHVVVQRAARDAIAVGRKRRLDVIRSRPVTDEVSQRLPSRIVRVKHRHVVVEIRNDDARRRRIDGDPGDPSRRPRRARALTAEPRAQSDIVERTSHERVLALVL